MMIYGMSPIHRDNPLQGLGRVYLRVTSGSRGPLALPHITSFPGDSKLQDPYHID